jgi:pimeloyl-ACP methyl ester carboxylesterase
VVFLVARWAFCFILPDRMQTVALNFEEFGLDNPVKLIILHGFFASNRNWRQIAQKLSEHFHVYNLDLRNHGASPHNPVMDYPTMAEDLRKFMDDQEIQKAVVMGHSMGGKVAMLFSLLYPDRIAKLIIADIAPKAYQHSFDPLINALKALPLATIKNRKQAEEILAPDITELSYRQFLLQNLILEAGVYTWRIDLELFKKAAPAIVGFPDVSGINAFTGAALFLAGENSNYVTASDIERSFPNADFKKIAHAGHWLHVQQPATFVEHVLEFLR